jgi:uracil-DNA glycosylase
MDELERLRDEIVACRACPRLVEWRETVARDKVARFADQTYWGRPVPGFGDPSATHRRARTRGARWQPDGAHLHR